MSEHKLTEQWIEVIEGEVHMVKAVPSVDIGACTACDFEGQESKCAGFPNSVCGRNSNSFIIKNLGVLNDDGLLPCPFCGEYPIIQNAYEGVAGADSWHGQWNVHCDADKHMAFSGVFPTKKQVIDDWNRRA